MPNQHDLANAERGKQFVDPRAVQGAPVSLGTLRGSEEARSLARQSHDVAGGTQQREVEVLRLLPRGLSNPQIAQATVVSPRTAEHYEQHIYTEIGVSTRAAAALFSMQHGLFRL
jgi:DNA-binding NarL/FixJ family response regulator